MNPKSELTASDNMSKSNRRDYVRIESQIGLGWERVTDNPQGEQLIQTFEQRSRSIGMMSELSHRSEELTPAMRKIREKHPEIAQYLKFLQATVETLAEQLSSNSQQNDNDRLQDVVLSAAGIEFNCTEICQPGDLLEIVFALHPSRARMLVIAEVMRADPLEIDGKPQWRLALAYRHIRDADQELLIRHIHRAQLEELRRARMERKAA